MTRRYANILFVLIASLFLLSGCATPTAYGPKGFSGGYEEQQIDESTYRVSFYGNGVTSQDRVWNFWIHRCAELTAQKGYTYFTLSREVKKSELPDEPVGRSRLGRKEGGSLIKVRGGGGGGGSRGYVPQYYYSPGGVITRYTGSAIVRMFNDPLPFDVPIAFRTKAVLDVLGPYVRSDGKIEVPGREAIIRSTVYARFGIPVLPEYSTIPFDPTPRAAEAPEEKNALAGQESLTAAQQDARNAGDGRPQAGDTWTYRYSDGYSRTETYKVRVISASEREIEDEILIGRERQKILFLSGFELTARALSGLTVREFSPYLQSFGPIESAGGSSVKLFDESKPFLVRFMGTERVSVPAGTFEAQKLVVEGTQFVRTSALAMSRDFKIMVWYAPTAKRFVKMTISAPEKGLTSSFLPAERDVIELVETSFPLTGG